MKRKDELHDRLAAQKFRNGKVRFITGIKSLLGSIRSSQRALDAPDAFRLAKEFRASYESAEPHDWALVTARWDGLKTDKLVAALHKLSENVGSRDVWLIELSETPQAVSLASEEILDNPLGFAALTDQQIALLDQEASAGLWLVRHSDHGGGSTTYVWELEVWGEPWLSAVGPVLRETR